MLRCTQCGTSMRGIIGNHEYEEAGTPSVLLVQTKLLVCITCGKRLAVLPDAACITIAIIVRMLLLSDHLPGDAITFLRLLLRQTSAQLAEAIGATEASLMAWECDDEVIDSMSEMRLRLLVFDQIFSGDIERASLKENIVETIRRTTFGTSVAKEIRLDVAAYYGWTAARGVQASSAAGVSKRASTEQCYVVA